MTVEAFLNQATTSLRESGIESARLDVLILLEDVLGTNRARLLAHPEVTLDDRQTTVLNNFIVQRKKHVPVAYIRGKAPFFGREFTVDESTLIPRPESESMISLLLQLHLTKPRIADIGTGSGCLGITAALELPQAEIFVSDTSAAALKIAARNAERYSLRIHSSLQDLLVQDKRTYDVILANLPYVPNGYPINQAAAHEPTGALFAGADGLDAYRRLWQQIHERHAAHQPQYVITEALPEQHAALATLATTSGYTPQAHEGYAQVFTRGTSPLT